MMHCCERFYSLTFWLMQISASSSALHIPALHRGGILQQRPTAARESKYPPTEPT